tara:strand:+ start:1253 stop:2017 length:765 start_codon:yes stop_codon:yes gene_type:complete
MALNTLYIYGDSFSVDYACDWIWTRQLAHVMNNSGLVSSMVNHSLAGASNDWIATHIEETCERWCEGDYVLHIPTEFSRQWWFKDEPELCNLVNMQNSKEARALKQSRPREYNSVMQYFAYLHRPEIDVLRWKQHCGWVENLARNRGVNFIQLPAFPIDAQTLSLTSTVSHWEFADESACDTWYSKGLDTRYNHMCRSNHTILANKLHNSYSKQLPLDLTQGWHTGFLQPGDRLTLDQELGELLIARAKSRITI